MKRRWIVVMLGLRGLAIGHRSELSRHRSQESARIAALEALARMRESNAGLGPDYTIVVEHNGQQFLVDDESDAPVSDPWGERVRAARVTDAQPIEDLLGPASPADADADGEVTADEAGSPAAVLVGADAEQASAGAATPSQEPQSTADPGEPGQSADAAHEGGGPASQPVVRRRTVREPDTPEGPVPASVLSRWEEKAAAYDEWEARQGGREAPSSG